MKFTVRAHPRVFGAQPLRVAATPCPDDPTPPDYLVRDGVLIDARVGVPAVCDCGRWAAREETP